MQNTGGRRRRRPTNRTVIRFRIETEYVNNIPHIVTLRPTLIENATPRQIAMWVVRRLGDATLAEVRRYFRRIGRRGRVDPDRIEVVINGILFFDDRDKH